MCARVCVWECLVFGWVTVNAYSGTHTFRSILPSTFCGHQGERKGKEIDTHIVHTETDCICLHLKDMFSDVDEVDESVLPSPSGRPRCASQCGTAWAEVPGLCVPH